MKNRFQKRTDKGQLAIVRELEACGIQTIVTNFGESFPDLIVCSPRNLQWVLLEIKEIDGSFKRGQLQFIADAKGLVGAATDAQTAYSVANSPGEFCFSANDKNRIDVWLSKNLEVKQIAVRKFFKEVLGREI